MANAFQGPPEADFYTQLSGLGDQIAKNRAAQAKREAVAAALQPGADGTIDYGRAMLGLVGVDPQAAALMGSQANHKDTIAQQAIQNERQNRQDAQAAKQFGMTYALQARSAARADDKTPAGFERLPDGSYRPLIGGPQDPKYLSDRARQIAEAEAATPGAGGASLNPIYGVGPDGKPAIIQTTKTGRAIQTELPSGFQISKEPIKIDNGTHFTLLDPQTRQVVGTQPKNLGAVESEKVTGEEIAKAKLALPQMLATSNQMLKTINDVSAHPGLDTSVGALGAIPAFPGSRGADFTARANQLKGQTFLQAYQTLRGSGAITDIEGKKGEDAIARLDRSQSPEAYREALRELSGVVKAGILRASAKAGMSDNAQPQNSNRTSSGVPWSIQ